MRTADRVGLAVRELDGARADDRAAFVACGRAVAMAHVLGVPEDPRATGALLQGRSALSEGVAAQLLGVERDGELVARCAAFVNPQYQREHGEGVGFVGLFAAMPGTGAEVAALLARAERWLAERGCTRVLAPVDGSPMVGGGLRTAAFDEQPMFPFPWNPPYYPGLFEAAGYARRFPLHFYEVDLTSDAYRATAARTEARASCAVRRADRGRWREELALVVRLMNASFADPVHWEIHSLTEAQGAELLAGLEDWLDPRLMFVAEVDGAPVGCTYGLLDWTASVRARARGEEQTTHVPERAGLYTIVVTPQARGHGVAGALATTLFRAFEARGFDRCLYYDVNEANVASRRFVESYGARSRVLYHAYEKALPA